MKRVITRFAMICMLHVSCNKTEVQQPKALFENYVIRQGNHYCDQSQLNEMHTDNINVQVMFDSTAIYTSTLAENQRDINKLIGFSDCATQHHENSARLGWSWNGSEVVIYAYAYVNAQRISRPMDTVKLNVPFPCSVRAENNYYYFTSGNHADSIPRYCTAYAGARYKLFPYFGGDEAAPHEVHIFISEE